VTPGPYAIAKERHGEIVLRHRICPRRRYPSSAIKKTYSAERKCVECRRKFNTLPSRVADPRRGKFCSRECWLKRWKAKKIKLSCHQCHRKFERSLPQYRHKAEKRGDKRVFCSTECLKAWRASDDYPTRRHPEAHVGYSRRPHKKWSEEGFAGEPHCAVCGVAGGAADHIVSISVILKLGIPVERAYMPENRMTLCGGHHGVKTGADGRLYEGDILEYLRRLAGWPLERVHVALRLYGLER
jgi:hypothetical protein